MSEHEGKDYRQHQEHACLILVGRRRVQTLLDKHGNAHDYRPDAYIKQGRNRQVDNF